MKGKRALSHSTVHSMTGFGRSEVESDLGRFTVEIKSVNGRYQEAKVSLPPAFSALETALRNRLKAAVRRGKIDCRIRFFPAPGRAQAVRFNRDLIGEYLKELREIAYGQEIEGTITVESVLRLPGATEATEETADLEEARAIMLGALDGAIEQLQEDRAREGAQLAEQIRAESALLRDRRERVLAAAPEVLARYRERLSARIAELEEETKARLDPGRLEIEVALYADRCDIAEEGVRLAAHLDRLDELVTPPAAEPVGKALDFLAQELMREVNTMTSKFRESTVTGDILEMKGAVERIREQIQNLE